MLKSDISTKLAERLLAALTVFSTVFVAAPSFASAAVVEKSANIGIIKGIVRDETGTPISDAYISVFRVGTSKLLKQVRSAADGSFLAKIIPGTYTVLAVAQGFNPITLSEVSVNRSTELSYGFKLERSGGGNTLPEKRLDRNNSKWRIRAAQSSRSIYQNAEGQIPVEETAAAADTTGTAENQVEENIAALDTDFSAENGRNGETIVETYFAAADGESFKGVNFARLMSVGDKAEIVFAGQTGTHGAPQRFETKVKFDAGEDHNIRIGAGYGTLGKIKKVGAEKSLGQFSVQGTDEWQLKNGVILVLGFDYSRLTGAGDDSSLTPRFGLQFDINSKTRFRTAYTAQTEEKTWARAIETEGDSVLFREPVSVEDFVVENGKRKLNKTSRLEFGIERVLDNNSSIEANAFLDTSFGRGVGLTSVPFDALSGADFGNLVVNQRGAAQGVRLAYTRRFGSRFTASTGYSFGNGQKLSENAAASSDAFENSFFQTFFGQFNADLRTGTQVKTIFRLSPQATVFAVDPFQGRLAIYDPSLSVLVTQTLPTLGLPFRAEAVMDARNLFDFQSGTNGEEGSLRLAAQRRMLRGGILVRF